MKQVPTRGVTTQWIMRSLAFIAGVDDKHGRAPDYDLYCFSQDEDDLEAKSKIDRHWNYERGRQWASLAPTAMPLKIDGVLNPKAVALYEAAVKRGYIAR